MGRGTVTRVVIGWASVFLGLSFRCIAPVYAEQYEGAVQIGDEKLGVSMVCVRSGDGALDIELAITRDGDPVRTALVHLTPTAGTVTTQGRAYPIPETIADSWWRQLADPLRGCSALGMNEEEQGMTVQSPSVMFLSAGIPGKAEIQFSTIDGRHPEVHLVRLFSLEEWDNAFHAHVALGIESVANRRIR
jgi:hypothetical protein